MLTDQLVIVETYTDLLLYRTSEFLKDADQIEPVLTIRSNVAAKNYSSITVQRRQDKANHVLLGYALSTEVYFYKIPVQI